MSSTKPIGFLDSGIGGISVLKRALEILPNENYVFFSDSANNPYGDKSDDEINLRCDSIVDLLSKQENCKAVVIACNTASAKSASFLREKYSNLPIIAIEPAYKMAHDNNPDGFTLVMATRGTLESEKFHRLYSNYNNHKTELIPCVGLADLIERGDMSAVVDYLRNNLSQYKGKADNVVLGCTHYPLAKNEIKEVLGDVRIFDGAKGVSRQLKRVLEQNSLLNESDAKGSVKFIDSSSLPLVRQKKEKRFYKLLSEDKI